MIKDKEVEDVNSCLNSAYADEPIFVLRANDELAPAIVREWAQRYLMLKTKERPHTLDVRQTAKMHDALCLAKAMEAWREKKIAATVKSTPGAQASDTSSPP